MKSFEDILGRENPLLKSVKDRGFEKPSEIQEKTIPIILKGRDVIAGAATGSGKTLAFTAALSKNIDNRPGIQGLILTPTRELAEQVSKEISDFTKYKNLKVIPVYGGVSINPQINHLRSVHIVVGTPGRILDHIERRTIDLRHINTLILDEADRMLDMGFREDVEKIISHCPKERQTLLYSATISWDISLLSKEHMNNPLEVSAQEYVDPSKLTQVYYDVPDGIKYSLLVYLLKKENARLVMIFCNTRRNVDFICNNLNKVGIEAIPIHGGHSQDKRNKILEMFHSNTVHVLVATDVAARGLDIKGVSHVYNYDIPPTLKEYTHRIGRTARAGKEGKVVNILASRDYENFQNIINSEFNLKQEKAPFIRRVSIKWVPEGRNNRRGDRQRNFGNRRNNFRRGSSGQRRNNKRRY
jgi:ATP-dependent RNA helicase DeaD